MDGKRWPSGFRRMMLGLLILAVSAIVIPASLILGFFLVWNFHVLVVAIPISIAAVAVVSVFTRAKLSGIGFSYAAAGNDSLYYHPCKHCTAGAVTLNTDTTPERKPIGWGPIPVKNRLWFPGTDHFHSPLANVKSCNYCQGRGFLLLPYPPKSTLTDDTVPDILEPWPEQ